MLNQERKGDWIQTYTGEQFFPLDPDLDSIHITDIAHALSNVCRFTGHVKHFYSVAQHSVLVSRHVSPENALWGLMHDASEAYIADIARPVKPYLTNYKDIERSLLDSIAKKFKLPKKIPEEVHEVDCAILNDERKSLMSRPPKVWDVPKTSLGIDIMAWTPSFAKKKFLFRFQELTRTL